MKRVLAATLGHSSGRIAVALSAIFLLFLPWAVWGGSLPHRTAIANGLWVPYDLLAAIAIWVAARHPRMPRAMAGAWTAIALAQLAYAGGDGLWAYYESVLGIDPWPSAADALYLLFYPLMLAGVLMFPHAPQNRLDRLKFWLDGGTVLIGGWMVIWYFVLGPTVLAGGESATTAWAAAYPIGDLVLLFGVAALLLRAGRGTTTLSLGLLAGGVFAFFIADIVFGYLSITEHYETGGWPDALFLLARLILVWAAAAEVGVRTAARSEERVGPEERPHGGFLPLAAVALGYAVVFVSGRSSDSRALAPLLYGAIVITLLVGLREIITARENVRLARQLRAVARTDELTGLLSRAEFLLQAEREFARFRRYHQPVAVIMLDLDNFKDINDRYGHLAGDRVLAHVARELSEGLRSTDLIARYGGDEFIVLLTDTDSRGASATASRIGQRISERPFRWDGREIRLDISAGVAQAQEAFPGLAATIEDADQRMYAVKRLRQVV